MTNEVVTVPSVEALHRAGAERFVASASRAIEARGSFKVALSGGTTPRDAYALLAQDRALRERVRWDAVEFFWGDERHVGPDDPESNYRMVRIALLDPLRIDPARIRRIRGELASADEAAREYDETVRAAFGAVEPVTPRFDLILLGLGADGHTASLFPRSAALHETRRVVVANRVPTLETYRITMTTRLLNAAAELVVLVSGAEKAAALRDVLQGPYDPERLPAQLVRPDDGRVTWLADQAAASRLAG